MSFGRYVGNFCKPGWFASCFLFFFCLIFGTKDLQLKLGSPAILFTLGGAADADKAEVSVHFLIKIDGF